MNVEEPPRARADASQKPAGPLWRRLRDPVVGQLIRFGVVGISNTLVFVAAYAICVEIGVWYIAASAIGYTLGSINGYVLNRRWTFRAGHLSHTTSASRYTLVQIVAALANLGLLYVFVDGIGTDRIVGQVIVIVIVQLLSFLAHRAWSFAHRGEDLGEAEVSPPVIVPPASAG
jgi:putative flippase GtrA